MGQNMGDDVDDIDSVGTHDGATGSEAEGVIDKDAPLVFEANSADSGATSDSERSSETHKLSKFKVIKNTVVLAAGSNFVALGRLVVLAAIFHKCGLQILALYTLLTEILKIAEGFLDFGASEIFVRELNQRPNERVRLLRMLACSKLFQIPIAALVMVGVVFFLGYSDEVLYASLFAAAGLVFQSLVLIYRAQCRAHLLMEREIGAEFLSVCCMFGLIYFVAEETTSIMMLFAYRLISTAVFGLASMVFSWKLFRPSLAGVNFKDIKWVFKSTVVIGAVGLLVVVYQSIDLILLDKFTAKENKTEYLAFYSAGQKLAWPLLMGLAAVGSTLYSVVTTHWPDQKEAFYESCQKGFNATFLLSGLALCPLIAGGRFFLGLLGDELMDATPALRILAVLCLAKAISMTIGPTLFVVHQQVTVLKCIAIALISKCVFIYLLVPEYGYIGSAWVALGVEFACVSMPSIWLVKKYTGFLPAMRVPLTSALAVMLGILIGWQVSPDEGLLAAIVASVIYVTMVSALGAVPFRDVIETVKRKRAGA